MFVFMVSVCGAVLLFRFVPICSDFFLSSSSSVVVATAVALML